MPLQAPSLLQKLILGHKDPWPLFWIWCPRGNVGNGKKSQDRVEQINPVQSIIIDLLRSTVAMRKPRHHELVEVIILVMCSSWTEFRIS